MIHRRKTHQEQGQKAYKQNPTKISHLHSVSPAESIADKTTEEPSETKLQWEATSSPTIDQDNEPAKTKAQSIARTERPGRHI